MDQNACANMGRRPSAPTPDAGHRCDGISNAYTPLSATSRTAFCCAGRSTCESPLLLYQLICLRITPRISLRLYNSLNLIALPPASTQTFGKQSSSYPWPTETWKDRCAKLCPAIELTLRYLFLKFVIKVFRGIVHDEGQKQDLIEVTA